MKARLNLSLSLALILPISALAGEKRPVGVARTPEAAMLEQYSGKIAGDERALTLEIDGGHYQYALQNGTCFGGMTKSGCFYKPDSPDQPEISVSSNCVSEKGALETYQISDLKLYRFVSQPICKMLALGHEH